MIPAFAHKIMLDKNRRTRYTVKRSKDQWGLSSAGRAPALQAGGHRFEPCRPQLFSKNLIEMIELADVAQLAEQLICNQQVTGSSPVIGSQKRSNSLEKQYGWVPERPKGADCKSVVSDFGGSNPPPSIQ